MTLYHLLLRAYPRAFREEYGEDMAQLFRHQLRDESAWRVWPRTLLDAVLTAPSLRLEARMSRPASAPVVYGVATVACLVLAVVAGTVIGVSILGIAGVLLFGSLGLISWRRSRTLGAPAHASAHWWKYLVGGCAVFAAAGGYASAVGELPESTWLIVMLAFLVGLGLVATGVTLGIARAAGRGPASAGR